MTHTLLLMLALSAPAAPPPLSVPCEARGEPGDFLVVKADTTGKTVLWKALDGGLAMVPADKLKDTKEAIVLAKAPGTYRLLAVTCSGDEMAEPVIVTVIISGGDALLRTLQAAYAAETDPDKAAQVKALATLYRSAASDKFLAEATTAGALFQAMSKAAAILGVQGKLKGVQTALATEVQGKLGTKDVPLDEATKKAASEVFLKVAKALEGIR